MEKPIDRLFLPLEGGAVCKRCGKAVGDQGLAKVSHAAKCKPRKLRTWNGRGDYRRFDGRFYVCAPTKRLAVELLREAGHACINAKEFGEYYSEAWGVGMEGIAPEIGVWFDGRGGNGYDIGKPERIL